MAKEPQESNHQQELNPQNEKTTTAKVITLFSIGGKKYKPGDKIKVTEEQSKRLALSKFIENKGSFDV